MQNEDLLIVLGEAVKTVVEKFVKVRKAKKKLKKNGKKKGVPPERYVKVIQSLIKEYPDMLRYYWFEWVEKPTYRCYR